MCHDMLWKLVKGLLDRSDIPHICFSYDTTFKLGDVYVSVLILRFEEFTSSPVVLLMVMLHERKLKKAHDTFFRKLIEFFPEIPDAKNIYFVTNEETAIVLAIKKYLPKINLYRCWVHLLKNAKLKLKRIGITVQKEVSLYTNDLRQLFSQTSEKSYYKNLSEILADPLRWSKVRKLL